jgi:hypothetical protein
VLHSKNLYLHQNLDAAIEGAMILSGLDTSGLRDTTLKVYLYTVKKNAPVGPREVMRGAKLSSPSVAYRHLQKLENMGLLIKDEWGNYIVKEKVAIRGYVWVNRILVPNPLLYAIFFLGILITELVVLAIHFSVETQEFKIFFLLLTLITAAALILFAIEGLRMLAKTRIRQSN